MGAGRRFRAQNAGSYYFVLNHPKDSGVATPQFMEALK
jgi:hypothetical protein